MEILSLAQMIVSKRFKNSHYISHISQKKRKVIPNLLMKRVLRQLNNQPMIHLGESNQEILTVKNNEDLAAVLAVKDETDPIIGEFAKKYAGRTIEFDGNIANMMQHGNYKTRYDILIYAGDYSETTAIGPNFKFEDVNVFDLNLTGSKYQKILVWDKIFILLLKLKNTMKLLDFSSLIQFLLK